MSESEVRMKFAVGDRITVQSESFKDQSGLRGTVTMVMRGQRLPYLVLYDAGQHKHRYLAVRPLLKENTYAAEDLVPALVDDTREYLNMLAELKGDCHG